MRNVKCAGKSRDKNIAVRKVVIMKQESVYVLYKKQTLMPLTFSVPKILYSLSEIPA